MKITCLLCPSEENHQKIHSKDKISWRVTYQGAIVARSLGHVKITQQYYLDLLDQKSREFSIKNRYKGTTEKRLLRYDTELEVGFGPSSLHFRNKTHKGMDRPWTQALVLY